MNITDRIDDISPDSEVHLESLIGAIPILTARIYAIDAALREVTEVLSGPPHRLRKAAETLSNACGNLGDDEPSDVCFSAMCLAQTMQDAGTLHSVAAGIETDAAHGRNHRESEQPVDIAATVRFHPRSASTVQVD
jgi:hypothetical protein